MCTVKRCLCTFRDLHSESMLRWYRIFDANLVPLNLQQDSYVIKLRNQAISCVNNEPYAVGTFFQEPLHLEISFWPHTNRKLMISSLKVHFKDDNKLWSTGYIHKWCQIQQPCFLPHKLKRWITKIKSLYGQITKFWFFLNFLFYYIATQRFISHIVLFGLYIAWRDYKLWQTTLVFPLNELITHLAHAKCDNHLYDTERKDCIYITQCATAYRTLY